METDLSFKEILKLRKMDMLEKLVASEVDINKADEGRDKFTPLHWACFYGNLEGTHFLLWHGANVFAVASRGWTPLHIVGLKGTTKCTESLLNYDADINAKDSRGCTPAHLAAIHGHSITLTGILKYGGKPNIRNENGWTPVHAACYHGRLGCLQVLYKCGGSIDEYDTLGNTPAHLCAAEGHVDCLKFLVANFKNIDDLLSAKNDHGETPLNLAQLYYKTSVVNYIIKAQDELVSTESRNAYSYPGHVVAFNGDLDKLKMLIENETIGLHDLDDSQSTYAHKAVCQDHKHVVEWLISAGADLKARNDKNETPADVARKLGKEDCLKLIEETLDLQTESVRSKMPDETERFANPLSRARVRIDELTKLLEIANKNYSQLGGILDEPRREEQEREMEMYILNLNATLEAERVKREKLEQKLDKYRKELFNLQKKNKELEHKSKVKTTHKIY